MTHEGMEPEARHRLCWYGRRTPHVQPDVSFQTAEDGGLLFCAHPMLFPVIKYRFDVRNCLGCDCFRPLARTGADRAPRA